MAEARSALRWRPARAEPASAPPPPPPPPTLPPGTVDLPAFIGSVAPDLTRLIGARVSLRARGWPEECPDLVEIVRLPLAGQSMRILLDQDALEAMVEAMFGGTPSMSPHRATILRLPPSSGTWVAAGRLISQAMAAGLAASGTRPTGAAVPPPRILAEPADRSVPHLWFDLLVAGRPGSLALSPVPAPNTAAPSAGVDGQAAEPPAAARADAAARQPATPDSAEWRARAMRLARSVEMAVGVRVAELRLPLAEVLALKPGSILPIAPPASLGLTVEGEPLPLPGRAAGSAEETGQ
ncbi:FliM/FliN family flagellar motor switch protein [Thermaurantiacus tibetensis]|uniref:FliM/FliN family flagellar motor switch protein n=1 Tax=Thermaurantiacus tibetensis TaxID=2759035 RepID=UPI00188F3A5F|nr:FliM/FliN family flagellar motor C-terminal domain-containing protein [Thermaurantiacus tibetensis]